MSYEIMNIATIATRCFGPPMILSGVLTNCLNIIILRQPNLKRHSCSLYFVILASSDLLYSCICITVNLLVDGYQIDPTRHSNAFCKSNSYLLNFCPHLSLYMLVIASIDRYCSSSLSARWRAFSNPRTARWIALIVVLFLALFIIPNAIIFGADENDALGCTSNSSSLFNQVYLIIQVTIYVIIGPFLMIFFGFLTIYNIQQSGRNRAIVNGHRPSERQLARMLIVQVSTHVMLNLPFCVIYFMLILPIPFRSTILFYFLFVLFKIPFYITFTTPFFLYILSAQVYRKTLIQLMKKAFCIRNERVIHPMTTQATRAVVLADQRETTV